MNSQSEKERLPKLLVISSNYPGPDYLYGDTFVHSRLKYYLPHFQVRVIGFNSQLKILRNFKYEGVQVFITPELAEFIRKINDFEPDIVAVHFIHHSVMDILLSLKRPIVVFVHGYEATAWYRRWFNYRSLGDLRYLFQYVRENVIQMRRLGQFVKTANSRDDIHFVFVSNWLYKASQKDIGISIRNAHTIPNGIDTGRFSYSPKSIDLRKRILILRSFKARNYANDIAIKTILLLKKKEFFSDLKICVQGEGYLFKRTTDPIRHFENVTLKNFFVENTLIPDIHKEHGIFLCPSRMDTQGVSMCEAMASGLVPITTPIGGIPEYCVNSESGFLTHSPEEMAEKIEYLYRHPDAFSQLSAGARNMVLNTCSAFKVIPLEIKLIKSLTEK